MADTRPELQERPGSGEFGDFYAGYISEVPAGADILKALEAGERETASAFTVFNEADGGFRYAEGKWSVREVAQHLADTERVMSYRALRFSRGDSTALPGFDENRWTPESGAERQTLRSLVDELQAVRRATIAQVRSLSANQWTRTGIASNAPVSVRALFWIIAGHEQHHLKVLDDRYRRALAEQGPAGGR